MSLYAVVVTDVYPHQCIVVWDRETSARKLSEHLNKRIGPHTEVKQVDSFFPANMTNADKAWINAAEQYLGGYHINDKG